MARLYIVRHGNTFDAGDTILRVGGRTDLDLSSSGQKQAEALAVHFVGLGLNAPCVICGPLKRTLQTASAISNRLAIAPAREDERLREVDYGPDEGVPEADVVARIGDAALAAWEAEAKVPEGWRVDTEALRTAWRDILEDAAGWSGDTIAVTSNGVARFVLDVIDGTGGQPLKLKTGAYGIIDLDVSPPRLDTWNIRP
ncbi:MAG: histidine phosphatase family protein [Pseudomonadota bacterium]